MRYNRKSVSVSASADSPAVSLADMKVFLRVDGSVDDDIITAYIATATEAVKQYLRQAILTETLVFKADGFTDGHGDDNLLALGPGVHTASRPYVLGGGETLELPFPPLQSVTSIVTYDRSNNASTYDANRYQVDLTSGRIYLDEGETWPSDLRAQDAVQVTYVSGYGSGDIPPPILEAIRMYVTSMYEGCAGMTDQAKALLAPYRRADELAW
tara:strand:- start:4389 stop:5027 length:639 start_codon:yes stop_codon:yes gene_type:complete